MEQRALGKTGLTVSAVGFGAGRIGGGDLSDAAADALVGFALEQGVTLFDTARSYGLSEERLGRALAGRREQIVLSTKVGYGVPGIADWTGPVITAGIDAALGRLRTDRLDLVHLHSCPVETLVRGGVVEALSRAVEAGKVRVAAYSGENEALTWAVRSGAFGAIQCSVSVVDQGVLPGAVAEAQARGLGVLAKRALGNAPWRFAQLPPEEDVAESWRRFRALALEEAVVGFHGVPSAAAPAGSTPDWPRLFARFAAHAPGVSSMLLGTASAGHLRDAIAAVAQGPLEAPLALALTTAYAREGGGWRGRV